MREEFRQIATFQYAAEAQIVKGKLEAEGIEVYLLDEFTISVDLLVSNAIGGIKLKVHQDQETKAREILKQIKLFSLDDQSKAIVCS